MSYNGHKNWAHWNVSLWLNNDEDTYKRMLRLVSIFDRKTAARRLLSDLPETTPDGARYSLTSIIAAMRGL